MAETVSLQVIARLRGELKEKFGAPRQAGLVEALEGEIVFEPAYRNPDALRGITGFSHLWLLWVFSRTRRDGWSPTVRPPRLGGNTRMGVFATRSPFRPNPLGLSCVRLTGADLHTPEGPVLRVAGADLVDGTPIVDIKPYLPEADCRPEARSGFAAAPETLLTVQAPPELLEGLPSPKREALLGVLAQDPRPRYQEDPERMYGLTFGTWNVRFRVSGGVLTVCGVEPVQGDPGEASGGGRP